MDIVRSVASTLHHAPRALKAAGVVTAVAAGAFALHRHQKTAAARAEATARAEAQRARDEAVRQFHADITAGEDVSAQIGLYGDTEVDEQTALDRAILAENLVMIGALWGAGKRKFQGSETPGVPNRPLWHALGAGKLQSAQKLLDIEAATLDDISLGTHAWDKELEVLRWCLGKKTWSQEEKDAALQRTLSHGSPEAAHLLLENGAQFNERAMDAAVGARHDAPTMIGIVSQHMNATAAHLGKAIRNENRGAMTALVEARAPTAGMFQQAAREGEAWVIETLLEAGAPLPEGLPRLAAGHGHTEILDLLHRNGADMSGVLREAVGAKKISAVTFIVETLPLRLEEGLLHIAAKQGDGPMIRELHRLGADLEGKDGEGNTPLLAALSTGEGMNAITALVDVGADVSARNDKQQGVFHVAARGPIHSMRLRPIFETFRRREAVLYSRDCENKFPWEVIYLDSDKAGAFESIGWIRSNIPLHSAAMRGRPILAEICDSEGFDLNQGDRDGNTPLHLAAINGREQAIATLIEKGANREAANSAGDTPLRAAIRKNCERGVKALCQGKASTEGALHFAYGLRSPGHIVNALVEADETLVNAQDDQGRTPWHILATTEYPGVRPTIRRGEHLELTDADGQTPLHAALRGGLKFADNACALISAGAKVDFSDSEGHGAFHILLTAMKGQQVHERPFEGIARALEGAGANPNEESLDAIIRTFSTANFEEAMAVMRKIRPRR